MLVDQRVPMRILFAGANRAIEGGAESYQRAVIPALGGQGHAVGLLYEHRVAEGRASVDGDVDTVPSWGTAELGTDVALAHATAWRPDVVYVHGLASPALEARLLDRWPSVLFAHDYYGTCETGTKRHAFPRITMCTRTFGPACLALHHVRRCGGLSPITMARMYLLQATRHALLPRYRTICVASEHMRSEYHRHGLPEERVHLLHYPSTGMPQGSAPPPTRPPGRHVVMVGRLTDLKGGNVLLDALPLAGKILGALLSLTLVGDGPERRHLEARARAEGVSVRFSGWTSAEVRDQILRTADLLVVPSLWPEPWGLVGLEAARVGVPAVAFAVGGIPEWLEAGQSGELAPADPPTPEGLASAIARALQDPLHYARLRRGAWEQGRRFTIDRHVNELLAVLSAAAV